MNKSWLRSVNQIVIGNQIKVDFTRFLFFLGKLLRRDTGMKKYLLGELKILEIENRSIHRGRFSDWVKGADVNAVTNNGVTALDKAKEQLKFHAEQLREDPDRTDHHSEQLSNLGKTIGILVANGAECATTC